MQGLVQVAGTSAAAPASLRARRCSFQGCALGTGVEVCTNGAAELENCRIAHHAHSGVDVHGSGARLIARSCTDWSNNGQHGVFVRGEGQAELEDCQLAYNGKAGACAAGVGTTLWLLRCGLAHNGTAGVLAQSGANIQPRDVQERRNGVV